MGRGTEEREGCGGAEPESGTVLDDHVGEGGRRQMSEELEG